MDPVTILGAASSAIGIASFGLQLVQVLTKYTTDAGAAAQNLNAALTNIRAASISIEHINHFLKEESERSKLRQRATLNTAGIRQIQYITDECLKVFWRVEAWVLDKDDSNELELRIANRLNEYKEDLKFGIGKPSQFLKVDEALAKVRKLRESRFSRYISALQPHRLDQYSRELHGLQASLSLLLIVINISTELRSGSAVKNTMDTQAYDTTPQNIERLPFNLHPEPRRIDEMNHGFYSTVNEYDTQYMNSRFIQPIGRTQFIPVTSGLQYIGNPYTQSPQSYVQQPDVYRRENPRLRRFVPPAVPDDPLRSSISEASRSYIKEQELNCRNTDGQQRDLTAPEHVIPSGDATINAAQSHMAHFDAKATQKPGVLDDLDACDTNIYPDYSTMVEKPEEVDNLSIVAQQSQKNFADFEHVGSDGKLRGNLDGKAQYPKTRECGNTKPGQTTPLMPPKAPSSESPGIMPASLSQASSTECKPHRPQISKVARPDIHMNNLTKRHKPSDLRHELNTAAPSYISLQAKRPKSEAPLDPKLEVPGSDYPKNNITSSNSNNPGNLNDSTHRTDNVATSQKQSSGFVINGQNQSRKLNPQPVRFDFSFEDLAEAQTRVVDEPENPIVPQVTLNDEPPRGNPEEIAQIVTNKLLVALPAIIPSQSQLGAVLNQPEHNIHENCAVKKDDIPKERKKLFTPVVERFSENINREPQIETTCRSPPSNLPVSPTVSSLTNCHSQPTRNEDFIKRSSMRGSNRDIFKPTSSTLLNSNHPTINYSPLSNNLTPCEDKTLDFQSNQSSVDSYSNHKSSKSGGLKGIFRGSHFTDDDIDRMVPEGTFMTAFFIKGHNYQQIPTVENFKLRKTEIERMLSKTPQQNWWKEFCFLEPAETDNLTQILKPQHNYRRELISLREIKKSPSRLWWRSEKGHIAIIITKPLAHLDTAPNSGLDFRYTPTRATASSSGKGVTFNSHVFEDIILRAMEAGDSLYCAYTIHPRIREHLHQSPDWVNTHITKQHFSKRHIFRRILELSTTDTKVVEKILDLTVLQQEQVQLIVNSENEVNGGIAWTLAQLEVVDGQYHSPGSDGTESITVYLVGSSKLETDLTVKSDKSGRSISPSATLDDIGADDIRVTPNTKFTDFTTPLKPSQRIYPEFSSRGTKNTEPGFMNSPKSVIKASYISEIPNAESPSHERESHNHYVSLQIPTYASAATIRDAYLSLYKTSHPILHPTDYSAGQRFVAITEAYETLGTARTREAYDRKHGFNQPPLERQPIDPKKNAYPAVKLKESASQHGNHRENYAPSKSKYDGRRAPDFVDHGRSPLRAGHRASEAIESDVSSSSDYQFSPRRAHEVGRRSYRRFPQRPINPFLPRSRNPSYDELPKLSRSRRYSSYNRHRSPSVESDSSTDEPRRTSVDGDISLDINITRASTYHPSILSFGSGISPSPRIDLSFDDLKQPSPLRTSVHGVLSAHSSAERALVNDGRPSSTSARKAFPVARTVTENVNRQKRYASNNPGVRSSRYGENYNDWSKTCKKIQPSPPSPEPRPTSYFLPSHIFTQEPVIPFDRRPAYYPDHYDGRSYNPHDLLGSEHAGEDILQQLLLKWTPAGEESDPASKQSEEVNIAHDPESENENKQPVEKQSKGKGPQQQPCDEIVGGSAELKRLVDGDQNERHCHSRYKRPKFCKYTSGSIHSSISTTNTPPSHVSSSKDTTLEVEVHIPDHLNAAQQPIQKEMEGRIDTPDTVKAIGRRPMATVEDDVGDSADFKNPSMFPRRAMTTMF